jgi:hypothetical protein
MSEKFKVRDPKLSENIFMLADIENQGALDIRELCGVLIFHLKGDLD